MPMTIEDLQLGEVLHRLQNLLSVAEAIACRMPTEGRTCEQFQKDFIARFRALIDAEKLAFSAKGNVVALGAILQQIVAPYAASPETIAIEPGPPVDLEGSTIEPLAMVLHELATNAAKYGAFSAPTGRVRLGWSIEDMPHRQLRIRWRERGGPPVKKPTRRGFGTELINSAISYALGGHVEQKYKTLGLEVSIVLPLPQPFCKGRDDSAERSM
jgi:two-component sensor histidine kinase